MTIKKLFHPIEIMNYTIKTIGNPLLRKKAKPVDVVVDDVNKLSLEMIRLMHDFRGIGLAATQIGVNKSVIVIDIKVESRDAVSSGEVLLIPKMPITLINPKIVSYSRDKVIFEEGCLSVPLVYANVSRSSSIVLSGTLMGFGKIEVECEGVLSVVIQHEIDHLNGVLFVDRISPSEYRKVKEKLDALKSDPVKERRRNPPSGV